MLASLVSPPRTYPSLSVWITWEGDTFQHRHAFYSGWKGVVWLEWTSGYHSQAQCRVFANDNVHDSELNSRSFYDVGIRATRCDNTGMGDAGGNK